MAGLLSSGDEINSSPDGIFIVNENSMTTKAIFSGGPYNQVEETLQEQPLIHKIREIFQNDEKGLRYDVH